MSPMSQINSAIPVLVAYLHPREVICGGCGVSMMLEKKDSGLVTEQFVYRHPDNHCEFSEKVLKPNGIAAGIVPE